MSRALLAAALVTLALLAACTATPIHLPVQGDTGAGAAPDALATPDAPATSLDGPEGHPDGSSHKGLETMTLPPPDTEGGGGGLDARTEGGLTDGATDGARDGASEARPLEAGAADLAREKP